MTEAASFAHDETQSGGATQGRVLTGEVVLDGKVFERCTFQDTTLIYFGGQPPVLHECVFNKARFVFNGSAGHTLAFLQWMSSNKSGLAEVFRSSFARQFGN